MSFFLRRKGGACFAGEKGEEGSLPKKKKIAGNRTAREMRQGRGGKREGGSAAI